MTTAAAVTVALLFTLTVASRLLHADARIRRIVSREHAQRAVDRAARLAFVNIPRQQNRWALDRKPSELPAPRVLDRMPHH